MAHLNATGDILRRRRRMEDSFQKLHLNCIILKGTHYSVTSSSCTVIQSRDPIIPEDNIYILIQQAA